MVWSWQLLTLGHYLARRTTHCGHQYVTEPVSGVKIKNKNKNNNKFSSIYLIGRNTSDQTLCYLGHIHRLCFAVCKRHPNCCDGDEEEQTLRPLCETAHCNCDDWATLRKKNTHAVLEQFLGHVIPNDLIPKRFVQF